METEKESREKTIEKMLEYVVAQLDSTNNGADTRIRRFNRPGLRRSTGLLHPFARLHCDRGYRLERSPGQRQAVGTRQSTGFPRHQSASRPSVNTRGG